MSEETKGTHTNSNRNRMHELVCNQPKREFWFAMNVRQDPKTKELVSLQIHKGPVKDRAAAFEAVKDCPTRCVAKMVLYSSTDPDQADPRD